MRRIEGVVRRRCLPRATSLISLVFIVAVAALHIVSTYPVFSHTYDEPAHLGAGLELIDLGTYTYEQVHPPLARLAAAAIPYMLGSRASTQTDIAVFDAGLSVLYGGDYTGVLSAARAGILPFFFLLVLVTWLWAYREFGPAEATIASLLLATTPPVLAHAGLATTDIPLAATFMAALFCFLLWLERSNWFSSVMLGAVAGLAITTKLSALAFLSGSCFVIFALRWYCQYGRWNPWMPLRNSGWGLPLGVGTFFLVIWAVYGFPENPIQPIAQLWEGIQELRAHAAQGHMTFFWGEVNLHGRWLFFPTAFLVKTPIAFLVLAAYGIICVALIYRRDWRYIVPTASAISILMVAILSPLNLGVRYILAVYPLLAITAAIGATHLISLRSTIVSSFLVFLIIVQVTGAVLAGPDYLGYFNPIAGNKPERILVDSDLDWGQDVNRAAFELRARQVTEISATLNTYADLSRHGFPRYRELMPGHPTSGWILISVTKFSLGTSDPPYDGFCWLKKFEPVALIGKSILLYHVTRADGKMALGC